MLPLQRSTQLNLVKNAETFNITRGLHFQGPASGLIDHLAAMSSRFFTTGMRR